MDENLVFITSLLGGGITSAVINQLLTLRNARKQDRIRFLENQIRELYGPLYYFLCQSEKLFEISRKFHQAYDQEYVKKDYSRDKLTQERINEQTTVTIDIANDYVQRVIANNVKMKELLDQKFALVDPDDIDLLLLFFEHHMRLEIEKDETGKLRTPFMIYGHIGDISFLPPEVIVRIKKKFLDKKRQLDGLVRK